MQFPEHIFAGRKAVIATMHGKEKVIAPVLEEKTGMQCITPNGFDTDRFGTFTGEIARSGNQLEAARKKAREALAHSKTEIGIASEGSFDMDPVTGLIPTNSELILLLDTRHSLEIQSWHRTYAVFFYEELVNVDSLKTDLAPFDFPRHGVVVRNKKHGKIFSKEIATFAQLEELFKIHRCKELYLETDLRAFANPTRMKAIQLAAEKLAVALMTLCPSCQAPGFTVTSTLPGLPCAHCHLPSDMVKIEIRTCQKCSHTVKSGRSDGKTTIDPGHCGYCNP